MSSLALLHAEVEDFYQACDPEKENLCLYGKQGHLGLSGLQSSSCALHFLPACHPAITLSCIYYVHRPCPYAGERTGAWSVELPAEEVPPELPEPCLGVNFARDGMARKDWLALVAVHSDAWLMAVAFFYAVKLDAAGRCVSCNEYASCTTHSMEVHCWVSNSS